MDTISKIRTEIERRRKSLRAGICDEVFTRKQKNEMLVAYEELDRLNRFLSTLESENPMNQDELEKDVKSWFFNEISSKINVEHTMYYYFQECARRYYELGRQSGSSEIQNDLVDGGTKAVRLPDGRYVTEKLARELEQEMKQMAREGN